jgi:sulfate adenylyltransferase subunit 1
MHTRPVTDRGLLRFLTCGSVDDGKSTLIGRLLLDSKTILVDALDALAASSRRRGLAEVDPSLITDGLEAEREQGITIDVAYRYFSTGTRKYILADTPGHEQYTRNMVTGASTADLAIVLIDARKGVLSQTRRHMTLAHLMGIRHVVVAVNKMDLVGWQESAFRAIQREVEGFASRLGLGGLRFLPLCALKGDMVVDRGENLPWHRGPTLLETLEAVDLDQEAAGGPFRFPVQLVCRPRRAPYDEFRGYLGRVESGRVAVGDAVTVLPQGRSSRVAGLEFFGTQLQEAVAGQSVTLRLEDELDVSRGDLLAHRDQAPTPTREVVATVCWLSERPLDATAQLLLRHGTRVVRAQVSAILGRLDLQSQQHLPARELQLNDIATVGLRLQQSIAPDPYGRVRAGGAFILIDEATNGTVAAGMVLEPASVGVC